MWAKVAKLASPAPRKPSAASEPPNADRLFSQLRRVLADDNANAARDVADEVARLLHDLHDALRQEQQSGAPLGPVLEFILENDALDQLVCLVLQPERGPFRSRLLEWYADAIDGLEGSWLEHAAVNKPLYVLLLKGPSVNRSTSLADNGCSHRIKLIKGCLSTGVTSEEEYHFVVLLCTAAERIRSVRTRNAVLLRSQAREN